MTTLNNTELTKIASSETLDGLIKLISEKYFYSNIYHSADTENMYSIHNKNGIINNYKIVHKRKAFILYLLKKY